MVGGQWGDVYWGGGVDLVSFLFFCLFDWVFFEGSGEKGVGRGVLRSFRSFRTVPPPSSSLRL